MSSPCMISDYIWSITSAHRSKYMSTRTTLLDTGIGYGPLIHAVQTKVECVAVPLQNEF